MPRLLLYCVKAKPYLFRYGNEYGYNQFDTSYCKYEHKSDYEYGDTILNGKIVAECDYEVEWYDTYWDCMNFKENNGLVKSCLTNKELFDYLKGKSEFYAIHIKNLHIFDAPKELNKYSKRIGNDFQVLGNAPQNMMRCCEIKYLIEDYILISIRPEWLCKILNGEKTIEVRKKVLKGMLENEK